MSPLPLFLPKSGYLRTLGDSVGPCRSLGPLAIPALGDSLGFQTLGDRYATPRTPTWRSLRPLAIPRKPRHPLRILYAILRDPSLCQTACGPIPFHRSWSSVHIWVESGNPCHGTCRTGPQVKAFPMGLLQELNSTRSSIQLAILYRRLSRQ